MSYCPSLLKSGALEDGHGSKSLACSCRQVWMSSEFQPSAGLISRAFNKATPREDLFSLPFGMEHESKKSLSQGQSGSW